MRFLVSNKKFQKFSRPAGGRQFESGWAHCSRGVVRIKEVHICGCSLRITKHFGFSIRRPGFKSRREHFYFWLNLGINRERQKLKKPALQQDVSGRLRRLSARLMALSAQWLAILEARQKTQPMRKCALTRQGMQR